MQRNKTFSIITIICFCSVIFIPIGLVLMWYSTQWSKKRKFILSGIMTIVYVAIVCFLMLFEPNQSGSGSGLPFGKGNQNVKSQYESEKQKSAKKAKQSGANPSAKENEDIFQKENSKLPKKVQKGESKALGKSFYTIMFFLFMLFIIIWQNLKAKKKTNSYENPYVDTKKYKLPLDANFKIPTVHFTKIELDENEKIIFATETTQKNQEGDFVVTDKRIIVLGKSENYEILLQELSAVSSITNSVMQISSDERKYYIYVPENQMKYAIAIVRWAYAQIIPK
ncbi:MAG: hypothetical protein PUJ82_10265 [Spirochaetales bacterium]|nr:hypothetical protein [Spirochaetales bacterium]MDY5916673.1 hypothetical protein [Treponema sp.]